jgi:hypothetical protein
MSKPQAFRPAFYATCYQQLQQIARDHGYNLLIHGSMNRDFDLVAVPWGKDLLDHGAMIKRFAEVLGGSILMHSSTEMCNEMGHGRLGYVIDLYRFDKEYTDHQFYLDIAVFPGKSSKPVPPAPPPDRIFQQSFWNDISQIFRRPPC